MKRLLLSFAAALALLFAATGHAQVVVNSSKTGIANGPTLIAATAVATSVTGTTTETILATVTIPGGVMGTGRAIEIRSAWSATGTNAKSMRVRFGGIAGTAYMWFAPTTSLSATDERRIRNRGAANSQVGSAAQGAAGVSVGTGSGLVTSAVDTSAAVDLVFTGQPTSAAESVTLESYEVWLLP